MDGGEREWLDGAAIPAMGSGFWHCGCTGVLWCDLSGNSPFALLFGRYMGKILIPLFFFFFGVLEWNEEFIYWWCLIWS
jgi:hypothetical protein